MLSKLRANLPVNQGASNPVFPGPMHMNSAGFDSLVTARSYPRKRNLNIACQDPPPPPPTHTTKHAHPLICLKISTPACIAGQVLVSSTGVAAAANQRGGQGAVYRVEFQGIIPPWVLHRLCIVLGESQGSEVRILLNTNSLTTAFNLCPNPSTEEAPMLDSSHESLR